MAENQRIVYLSGPNFINFVVLTTGPFGCVWGTAWRSTDLYIADFCQSTLRLFNYASGTLTPQVVMNGIYGLVFDNSYYYLYATSYLDNIIYQIDVSINSVVVVAGTPGVPGWLDGPGLGSRFDNPTAIAIDEAGTLYVACNAAIRYVTITGGAYDTYTLVSAGKQ